MIAFVYPGAASCSHVFCNLGYIVQICRTPFDIDVIKKTIPREHIDRSGCYDKKEYPKLHGYALADYAIMVHLDLDSPVLKLTDDIFHAMLGNSAGDNNIVAEARSCITVTHDVSLPANIDAYFVRDYNMIQTGHKYPSVQGGFVILKPSMAAFHEYVGIVKEEGLAFGGYFGAKKTRNMLDLPCTITIIQDRG